MFEGSYLSSYLLTKIGFASCFWAEHERFPLSREISACGNVRRETDMTSSAGPSAPPSKVSLRNYLWGVGGIAENFLSFGLAWTIIPIFNIGYGVDAFWLGLVIFFPRLIDVVIDPFIGVISDRTKSRFGRRKPYIFWGAIGMSVFFAILWMPPWGAVDAGAATHGAGGLWGLPPLPVGQELWLLVWVGVVYSLLSVAFGIFSVPYSALGYEFTENYDEMTKVMAVRLYFCLAASLAVTWIYRLSMLDVFGGKEIVGMRYVGVAVAAIALLTGIAPAIFCTESRRIERPEGKFNLGEIARATLANRSFVTVMFTMFIFVMGMYTAGVMGPHISIYYVAQGDKAFGAHLGAISGNIGIFCNLVGMYLMLRLSKRFSKKSVLLLSLSLVFIAIASFWWTWNPKYPELQYLSAALNGFGNSGLWLLLDSMIGDVVKDDEARNGVQREGLYGASKCFIFKISLAVTSLTGAMVINLSGFQVNVPPSDAVLLNLRLLYIGIQLVGTALAIVAIAFYPITRERAERNARIIDERKAAIAA